MNQMKIMSTYLYKETSKKHVFRCVFSKEMYQRNETFPKKEQFKNQLKIIAIFSFHFICHHVLKLSSFNSIEEIFNTKNNNNNKNHI